MALSTVAMSSPTVNHDVTPELLSAAHQHMKLFFGLPLSEKQRAHRKVGESCGYASSFTGRFACKLPWKETMSFEYSPTSDVCEYFVKAMGHEFRDTGNVYKQYCQAMERLSLGLMELLALSLGVERMHFRRFFEANNSIMRLNYYPPCQQPYLTLGTGPHCDPTSLTILHQDEVGGLEVFINNKWLSVRPKLNAFVVNIGDTFMVQFQKMNLLLPSPEAFSTAMYFIFIGINDFFHAYTLHQSMTPSHANQTIVPSLLEYVSDAIQGLFALGARTFVIVNVPPLGCTPDMLSLALTRNMTGHDSAGCLISVNSVIQNYNHLLLQKLQSMAQNPSFRGTIELYDSYQTYYDVVHNPEMHGFASSSITKCCYDKHNVCSDPSKHIHWDGIHFTDAFNKQMLKSFLTGPPASRTSHKISASTSTHSTLADVCSLHLSRL